jgi:hypothetical protein
MMAVLGIAEVPMPIRDWTRIPAGLFHHFHLQWAVSICKALNAGRLPQGFYALIEQHAAGVTPHVVTLERGPRARRSNDPQGGIAVGEAPPKTRFVSQASDEEVYAARADRIAVHNPLGDFISIIELVSPGNKNSRHAIRSCVEKTLDLLLQGIHILIIDLFPPGPRDPHGIHELIWDEVREEPFELPADKPLTLVAYWAGVPKKRLCRTSFGGRCSVGDAGFSGLRCLHSRSTRVDVSLDVGCLPRTAPRINFIRVILTD